METKEYEQGGSMYIFCVVALTLDGRKDVWESVDGIVVLSYMARQSWYQGGFIGQIDIQVLEVRKWVIEATAIQVHIFIISVNIQDFVKGVFDGSGLLCREQCK